MESIGINVAIAVVSAILTFLITNHFKEAGKVTVRVPSLGQTVRKSRYPIRGASYPPPDEQMELHLSFGLEIYNSSATQKSLGSIQIVIESKYDARSYHITPYFKQESSESQPKFIFSINLPPKEYIHVDLECSADRDSVREYGSEVAVYFQGLFPNNKVFRAFLTTLYLQ